VLGGWEFDAVVESVLAPVFFGHASPDSETLWMVENIVSAGFEDGAGFADCFGMVHSGCVATVDEEQMSFAFTGGLFCPVVEGFGDVGCLGHS
jgi:hypothetical protein